MSGPSFTHHEVSEFKLPAIHPRGLSKTFGEWAQSDPDKLWAALLVVCQGKALAVTSGRGRDVRMIWTEPDSGFRESLSTHLASQLHQQIQEPEPTVSRHEAPDTKVCVSLKLPGDPRSCALVLDEDSPQMLSQRIALFQAGVGYLVAGAFAERSRKQSALLAHSSAWVDLSADFMDEPYFESACLRLAEGIQRHLGVEGVAVGSSRAGKRGTLHAFTGLGEVDARGRLAEVMQTLFSSAHDEEPRVKDAADPASETLMLKEVRKQLHISNALLLPLGEPDTDRRFHLLVLGNTDETSFLQALSRPLSVLLTTQYATRPRGPRKWISQLVGEQARWKTTLAWVSAIAALVFLLQPVPSRLRVEGELEPVQRRMISAKLDGLLLESPVRPGDVVEEGQLLARLEDRELRLREAEVSATRERRLKRRDALAGSPQATVAERQIAALELEETEKELALIRFQREQLTLNAPIRGVILAGDLSRRLGSSVQRGDLLFELAPLESMRADLKVPSRKMSGIEVGLPVSLRLDPYPEQQWEGHIQHIHGRSISTDPENPFLIQVPLPETSNVPLRPGMQARGVILGETRPRILHWLQPWVDQARIFFFR